MWWIWGEIVQNLRSGYSYEWMDVAIECRIVIVWSKAIISCCCSSTLRHECNSIVPAIEPPVLSSTTLIDLPCIHLHIHGQPLSIQIGIILSSLLIWFLGYSFSHSMLWYRHCLCHHHSSIQNHLHTSSTRVPKHRRLIHASQPKHRSDIPFSYPENKYVAFNATQSSVDLIWPEFVSINP